LLFHFLAKFRQKKKKKKGKKSLGRTQEAKGTTSVGANSHWPKPPQPIIGQKKRESDTFRAVVSHGGSWAVSVAKLKNFREKGFFRVCTPESWTSSLEWSSGGYSIADLSSSRT
jgi:hypothetical protein